MVVPGGVIIKKLPVLCLFLISAATCFVDAASVRRELMVDVGFRLQLSHTVA
jgi:hypothetical protein